MSGRLGGPAARLARFEALQDVLDDLALRMGPADELQPVLELVLEAMQGLVGFKGGSICLVDGDQIRLAHAFPEVSQEVLDARLPIGQGLSGWIVANRRPVRSDDIRTDPQAALQSVGSNATIRSYVGVPLVCAGTVIGLLQVDSAEPGAYDDDDVLILRGLATHVASSIEAARRLEDQRRLRALQQNFISRVSHELRTPVTVINGFTMTLAEHAHELSREQIAQFVRRMDGASTRLADRVKEIVALASLDAGLRVPEPQDVIVADVLAEAVASQGGAVENAIPITVRATTDPTVLRHAVAPLLDNARRHAVGGSITARRQDDRLVVEVTDDGPGIPEEERARIFDRFSVGGHNESGIGLGLAVADSLAGTLGGRVMVDAHGSGSRFRLVVPDLRTADPQHQPQHA